MSGEGAGGEAILGRSNPERGILDILRDTATKNPPGEFQMAEQDYAVLREAIVLPAARCFHENNRHLDLQELCSEAVICLANCFRAALVAPSFVTAERSLANRDIVRYLRAAIRNHFLEKCANVSVAGEVRARLQRAVCHGNINYDEEREAYRAHGADRGEILSAVEVERLSEKLPLQRGKGFSHHFNCNLPTSGQMERLLLDVLNSTGKGILARDFVDLAIRMFSVTKNEFVSLDEPLGEDSTETQEQLYGEEARAEAESGSLNVPASISYHLPAEVDAAKRKILATLEQLDRTPQFQKTKPFFHSFFELWLWEHHPIAKQRDIGAVRYAELTGVPYKTRHSQRTKLFSLFKSFFSKTDDERVSQAAFAAALADLREEHIDIFRKRWGLGDLTWEAPRDD